MYQLSKKQFIVLSIQIVKQRYNNCPRFTKPCLKILSCSISFSIFTKINEEFYKQPLSSLRLKISIPKRAFLLDIYCLNLTRPFQSNNFSLTEIFCVGIYTDFNFSRKCSLIPWFFYNRFLQNWLSAKCKN